MIEGLTVGQTRALTGINVGASVLSFMGSFFVVLCFVAFKDLRKFSFKLVFYLSLSVHSPPLASLHFSVLLRTFLYFSVLLRVFPRLCSSGLKFRTIRIGVETDTDTETDTESEMDAYLGSEAACSWSQIFNTSLPPGTILMCQNYINFSCPYKLATKGKLRIVNNL